MGLSDGSIRGEYLVSWLKKSVLFKNSRFVHIWLGVVLAIVISTTGITGFLLQHDDWIRDGVVHETPKTPRAYFDDENAKQLLALATAEYGGDTIKEVEIRVSGGGYRWQIRTIEGTRITIRNGKVVDIDKREDDPFRDLVDDLHTGDYFGDTGELLVDIGGISVAVLSLTGLYLWAKTTGKKWWRRLSGQTGRQRARAKSEPDDTGHDVEKK